MHGPRAGIRAPARFAAAAPRARLSIDRACRGSPVYDARSGASVAGAFARAGSTTRPET